MAAGAHVELRCGCLIGEDGPVVHCRKADELLRRNDSLLVPIYDNDDAAWDAYNGAQEEYRRHVRTSS